MIGNRRERFDRTQATFFCLLIAVLGSIPTWFTVAVIGGLS